MSKILPRVQLGGPIVVFPGVIIFLLIEGNFPQKEEHSLILAIQLQALFAVLFAFLILPQIVIYLSNQVIRQVKIWKGGNQAKSILYDCLLLSTLKEKFNDGFIDG